MKTYEADEQAALFGWAELMEVRYPELRWMHHIPNGGSRNPIEAANLKKQGVKSGVSDIFLPVPRANYHGFYVEMKSANGVLSDNQKEFLTAMKKQHYATCVCYSWEAAKAKIEKYLELK